MPYIPKECRGGGEVWAVKLESPGELNFVLSTIMDSHLSNTGISYGELNALVGMLEIEKTQLINSMDSIVKGERLVGEGSGYQRQDPTRLNLCKQRLIYFINKYLVKKTSVGYTDIEALVGVLECVKLELYRRVASPYEDKKLQENGDVYTSIKKEAL